MYHLQIFEHEERCFRAVPWSKTTVSPGLPLLACKMDLGWMYYGSQDNHSQVLCQQYMTALVCDPPAKDQLDQQPPPQHQATTLRQSTAQPIVWSSLPFLSTMLDKVLGALKDKQGQDPLILGPFDHSVCCNSYVELFFSAGLFSVMPIIQFRCGKSHLCPFFFSCTSLEVGLQALVVNLCLLSVPDPKVIN